MTAPTEIIDAFEEIRELVFGARRREYHETDETTAQTWIGDGITLPLACYVFSLQMNRMHEKSLSWGREREYTPWALKVFDKDIESVLHRQRNGGGEISTWEQSESQWRARLKEYFIKHTWLSNMWGPTPDEKGCRAPMRLIKEIYSLTKKDCGAKDQKVMPNENEFEDKERKSKRR